MKVGLWQRQGVMAFLLGAACWAAGETDTDTTFRNPIIPGFAPDPSIVRVGEDYYIVNSSFEYSPAIPIYHSTDLVNWGLIGYAANDPKYPDLSSTESSGGIQAATIRYHDGLFFIVTTKVTGRKLESFIVTAENPRGPWSAPVVVRDAVGIDPSLFFDDDGRAWYTASMSPPAPEFRGQKVIWLQELDLGTLQLVGERKFLWSGTGGSHAEGPHLFKRNGIYYLLLAEGGTSFNHAVTIASAHHVDGPYVGNPRNPVLTHRHLSYDFPITGVGHADLVELPDGRWFGVALGWRLIDGLHGVLGRETFLFPIKWETDRRHWKEELTSFPVMSPESGKIESKYPLPFPGSRQLPRRALVDEFEIPELAKEFNWRRTQEPFFSLVTKRGVLQMKVQATRIGESKPYSLIGVRQRDFIFSATTEMTFLPRSGTEEAGLVVIQNDRAALLLTRRQEKSQNYAILSKWLGGERTELSRMPITDEKIALRVDGNFLHYQFYLRESGGNWRQMGNAVDGTFLSPDQLTGFNYTGLYVGLYASSNGASTNNTADFERFTYEPEMVR